jgi:hypothetical protein
MLRSRQKVIVEFGFIAIADNLMKKSSLKKRDKRQKSHATKKRLKKTALINNIS